MSTDGTARGREGRVFGLRAKLFLALGSAALGLLAVEVALRVRAGGFGPTTNPRYTIHDEELGWRYRPGAQARHRSEYFDVDVRINSAGFRDSEFAAGRSGPSIVMLGDSLTFGWGVEVEDCFADLLEEALGVPVMNLGASGYSTDQQLLLWRREGRRLEPRIVVVTVCENDPMEAVHDYIYGRGKPVFGGEPLAPRNLPLDRNLLASHSHLFHTLEENWAWLTRSDLTEERLELARAHVVDLLVVLASEVRETGAELVVVTYASPWLDAPMAEASLLHLDAGPALEDASAEGPTDFGGDPHWNEHGHQAVAAALGAFLRERALVR